MSNYLEDLKLGDTPVPDRSQYKKSGPKPYRPPEKIKTPAYSWPAPPTVVNHERVGSLYCE